jgi:folate-binding protein YgfZ
MSVTGWQVDGFDQGRGACYRNPHVDSQELAAALKFLLPAPRACETAMCLSEAQDPSAAREDVARVDLGGMAILRCTGADRIGFLHRLTTGSVQGVGVGVGCRSLLLDSKGHVMGDLCVCARPDEVRLVVAAAAGQGIAAALTRYAVMDDFAVAVEPDSAMDALRGPGAAEALRAVGVSVPDDFAAWPLWSHADAASPFGSLWLVRSHALGSDGLWVFGATAVVFALAAALDLAGVPVLAPEVAEALRIQAGEPRFGAEITGDALPMELGLASAIDHKKGCYLGQETIARVRDRGLVRRRLATLRLHRDGMPAAGDAIASEQNPAGHVTSAARVPGQAAVALALLASSVPVGAEVRISHGSETLLAEVIFDQPVW